MNYLKATRIEVGLVLNFGPSAEIKRRVYDNDRKGSMTWMERQVETDQENLDTDDAEDTDQEKNRRE